MHEPILSDSFEPASRFFFSQRLRLHYLDWGNASAPPLIMVHGGRDHCRAWEFIARRLRHKWHVITPDLRGHGDSAWADGAAYSFPNYIYDLAQLIDGEGLGRPVMIAHSLGGNIALRYTGLFPGNVRAIIAIEGLGPRAAIERGRQPIEIRMPKWIEATRQIAAVRPRLYMSLEEAVGRMREAHPRYTPELALHLTRHGLNRNEDGTWVWKYDPYIRSWPPNDFPHEEVRRLWGLITCPTLLIGGRESWHVELAEDDRVASFKAPQIAMFDAANHWVHHDQPEAFLAKVEEFLGRV